MSRAGSLPHPVAYVFDLDGVLYRMDEPVPWAREALERLRAAGRRIFFLTNNSSKTRADYVAKLAGFGIPATEEEVMTSAYALGVHFAEAGAAGSSVYVIGEQGLVAELQAAGMRVVPFHPQHSADYVVVGWDRGLTYTKLAEAHRLITAGSRFIATNRDATYPDAGGLTLPGNGAAVAALVTSTGVNPLTIGKPEPYTVQLILRRAGIAPEQCLVVGDRLDTDIAAGKRVGTPTALVLTGVTSRAEAEAAPPHLQPDFILEDLRALP
ncbi:MAG: HAD-IIA family hydrolase [Chthonomonadales bacterium]